MTTHSASSPTTQTLLSTSKVSPSRLNVPLVTRVVDARRPSEDHHRAQHVAAVHLLERRLDVADADLLGDERVEVEPALLVEVDQHREVAATAGSRRTSSTSARRRGRRRRSAGCRGSSCPASGRRPARRCRPGRGRRTPASRSPGRPTASITTSAPLPPVSAWIASTGSVVLAVHGVGGAQSCARPRASGRRCRRR